MAEETVRSPSPPPKGDVDDLIFRRERPSQPSQR